MERLAEWGNPLVCAVEVVPYETVLQSLSYSLRTVQTTNQNFKMLKQLTIFEG